MNGSHSNKVRSEEATAAAAAEWVMRLDRGLLPEEQDQYLQWLATDARHAEAVTLHRRTWETFDRLAGLQSSIAAVPDPDLLAPVPEAFARRKWRLAAWISGSLLAAAGIAFAFWLRTDAGPGFRAPEIEVAGLAPIEERKLDDGSVVRLNRDAAIVVEFSAGERRVRLEQGEAAFEVAKDANRPFVVISSGIAISAVGTSFNVRLGARAVDLIVVEGSVAVGGDSPRMVTAGQRAMITLGPNAEPPVVSTPPPEELARRLAWLPRLLTFTDDRLAVILNEFNRHNSVVLRIEDPALQELRLTARFRSDNVQGFLRLLESDFGVRAHHLASGEIVIRYAP